MEIRLCLRARLDGRCWLQSLLIFEEGRMVIENEDAQALEVSDRTAELAARLAPVEEQQRHHEADSISSPGNFKVSKVFLEESGEGSSSLLPHPVVLFVLGVAIAFISFIAILIALTTSE